MYDKGMGHICIAVSQEHTGDDGKHWQIKDLGPMVVVAFVFLPKSSNNCLPSQHAWCCISVQKQWRHPCL